MKKCKYCLYYNACTNANLSNGLEARKENKICNFYLEKNNHMKSEKQESNSVSNLIGKQVAIVNLSDFDGNKPNHYDCKYIGKAENRVVTIVHKFKDRDLYLTDFFIEEFMEESNDYIHYGFLKILRGNFKMLEQ